MTCREERRLRAKVKRLINAMRDNSIFTEAIKKAGLNCSINRAHTLLKTYAPKGELAELVRLIRWK